jgi:transcriptional regulator with XRE-family HTH domain
VNIATISRIEVGTRDMKMSLLFAIADELGISPAEFLEGAQAAADNLSAPEAAASKE